MSKEDKRLGRGLRQAMDDGNHQSRMEKVEADAVRENKKVNKIVVGILIAIVVCVIFVGLIYMAGIQ